MVGTNVRPSIVLILFAVVLGAPATPAKLGALLGPFNQVREIMAQSLEEMLLGGKDPVEALDDAAARITDEIQEYNQRVGE